MVFAQGDLFFVPELGKSPNLGFFGSPGLIKATLPRNQSTFWQMPSNEAAERFVGFVDFVFVDGSHAYEDVFLDLRVASAFGRAFVLVFWVCDFMFASVFGEIPQE